MALSCLPLCHLLIQGFYPRDLFILAKGAGHLISRGAQLFFDLFPLLAISQVVAIAVVALYTPLPSPFGLFFLP